MKSLKQALKKEEGVQVTHKYYINLPMEEAHHKCHPTKGIMGLSQRVHPELIAKNSRACTCRHNRPSGGTAPAEASCTPLHVHRQPSQPQWQAYNPTLDDIQNHISKAKRAMQLSVIDQENALRGFWGKYIEYTLRRGRDGYLCLWKQPARAAKHFSQL